MAAVAVFYRASIIWKDSLSLRPDSVEVKKRVNILKWFPITLGLGGWLFLMHLLFSDVAVLSRWIVGGYPKPGPMPNPWG